MVERREAFLQMTDLGSCSKSADALLTANLLLQDEAAGISERCLQCVKLSQERNPSGTTPTSVKAYQALEQSADYQQMLEKRSALLTQSTAYFTSLTSYHYSLNQIDTQLRNATHSSGWDEAIRTLNDIWDRNERSSHGHPPILLTRGRPRHPAKSGPLGSEIE